MYVCMYIKLHINNRAISQGGINDTCYVNLRSNATKGAHSLYLYKSFLSPEHLVLPPLKCKYLVVVVVCCSSHSAYWLPTRKKLLYTVINPARGLLNREKRTKEKVWQHTPPPHPPPLIVRRKINKITRRIYRRYAGLGRSRVPTRIPSARRLGQWVWLRKILHSFLR